MTVMQLDKNAGFLAAYELLNLFLQLGTGSEGWESDMSRYWLVVLTTLLLVLGAQTASAAAPLNEETPQESRETLQVMFLDGAGIYSDATTEQRLLTTASCGTLLTYHGSQDGEWFLVSMGDVKGWVSGWLTTFDKEDKYCLVSFPIEQQVTTQTVSYGGSYADTVAAAAATYGVSFDWLWAVVGCESTYNLYAVGASGEYGPFQFMEGTFYSFAALSGIGGVWTDPVAQAYVAAWAFANGYAYHWTCA